MGSTHRVVQALRDILQEKAEKSGRVRSLDTTTLPANSRAHTGAKEANDCVALHYLEN